MSDFSTKKNNNRGEWRFFFRRREWCEDNSVLHRAYKKSWRNFIEKLFSLAEKKKEKKKKERKKCREGEDYLVWSGDGGRRATSVVILQLQASGIGRTKRGN